MTTPVAVEGETKPESIANKFKEFYANVYVNSADDVNVVMIIMSFARPRLVSMMTRLCRWVQWKIVLKCSN